MSEFRCINDHLMKPGDSVCQTCGETYYTMDGLNANQLRQMEDDERVSNDEGEEE